MHKSISTFTRNTYIVLAMLVTLSLSGCAFGRQSHAADITRAQQIADGLGRTKSNQLAEFEACWDLNSECGYLVYFTTHNNGDTIQFKLSALGLDPTQHAEGVATSQSTMGSLSLHYAKQLQATGNNPASDTHTASAISWNTNTSAVVARLYRLQVWPQTYSFEGKPIKGDLIEITVRYPSNGP